MLNLPFGAWRSRLRRRSPRWFVAIHAPIPGVVALRLLTGLGYAPMSFPVIIGAYFLGQVVGGKVGGPRHAPPGPSRNEPPVARE